MQKLILLLWLWFSVLFVAVAQIPTPPKAIQSPNAAALGEYGEVPVSLYTGTPNVGVPLYTVQESGISIPIELNYRASGVRPDTHPGWVGMDWTLSAGGVITRTVNDSPDDLNISNSSIAYGAYNGYHFNGTNPNPLTLNRNDWNTNAGLSDIARNYFPYDSEPDKFSFNFPGYSGEFYRSKESGATGSWQVRCNKPVTVRLNDAATPLVINPIRVPWDNPPPTAPALYFPPSFGGFTIITEDGTQYTFGHLAGTPQSGITAIEYSMDIRNQRQDYWTATAWYLTKIRAIDGHEVTFNYQREARHNGMFISSMYSTITNMESRGSNGGGPVYMNCWNSAFSSLTDSYGGKLLAPVYLSSIQNATTTVQFYRSTSIEKRYARAIYANNQQNQQAGPNIQNSSWPFLEPISSDPDYVTRWNLDNCLARLKWKQLDSIQIRYQGTRMKSFALRYSNYGAESPQEFTYSDRLLLKSVQEKGIRKYKPAYQFSYYLGSYKGVNYGSLPDYVANMNDHWGFYNAQFAFPNRNNANYWVAYASDRNPNTNSSIFLCGMLAQITYPTGGVTEFEYEQHTYSKQLNQIRSSLPLQSFTTSQAAGGVRIRKTRSYSPDNPTQDLIKEYFYVSGYANSLTSSQVAQLPSSGVLGGKVEYYFSNYTVPSYNGNNGSFTQSIFSSQPVLPRSNNAQGSHIGYTHVVEKRSDGSYTKYEFTNFDNGHLDETAGPGQILQTSRTAYEPYSSTEEERGKLLVEDMRNNTDQTVKRRDIVYAAFNKNAEAYGFVRAVKANRLYVCAGTGVNYEEATAYKDYTYSYLPMQETETICDASGNNCRVTSKTYTYNQYKLVVSESTTDSKGQALLKTYKYATDFTYPTFPLCSPTVPTDCYPQIPGDPFTFGLTRMLRQNMIGVPIETVTYRDGNMLHASVQTYVQWRGGIIKPYQYFETETAQPSPYQYGSLSYVDPFELEPDRIRMDPLLKLRRTFTAYDAQGNVLSMQDADAPPSSYVWGYQQRLPLAVFTNASRVPPDATNLKIGNEASYLGFESGMASSGTDADADYWDMGPEAGLDFLAPQGTAHTGNFAWQVGGAASGFNYGPGRVLTPERQGLRYKLSAWVKTNAGFGANDGRLVLSVNRADGTPVGATVGCYAAKYFGGTNGQWQYIEVVLDLNAAHTNLGLPLPTNTERLQLSAYSYNAGSVPYLIDDLRFQPVESAATTYTHVPLVGVTTMAGVNGRPISYEYDGLQRLKVVRDAQGNIVKQQEYNYKH